MADAKPRILFLITTSDWGGAQLFVHRTAVAAKKHGHEVMVAAGGSGELATRCKESGIPFARLETVRREISPFHDIAAIYEIRQLLREWKPSVVHLNSSIMSVIGSIAANLERIPRIIYRIGGWAFLEDLSPLKRALYLYAEKWTASKKDIIVTVHPGDEEEAKRQRILPRQRLFTIPNGLDLRQFDRDLMGREEARRSLGCASKKILIGTIANYYPPKEIPAYLRLIHSIRASHPELQFVIIGDGPQHDEVLQSHQKLNLGEVAILAGRRSDASQLLRAFDIFVLPSSKEGMPWTLLEAMAAGLPCITTDVGACRWMLEPDAGIIVPPKNPEALCSNIINLSVDQTQRKRLGFAARSAVEKRFRWETTEAQTFALFS